MVFYLNLLIPEGHAVWNFFEMFAISETKEDTRAWTILHMWNTERIYQFHWILTQTQITSIRNLHMHIISISAIMIFYDSKGLPLK